MDQQQQQQFQLQQQQPQQQWIIINNPNDLALLNSQQPIETQTTNELTKSKNTLDADETVFKEIQPNRENNDDDDVDYEPDDDEEDDESGAGRNSSKKKRMPCDCPNCVK